VTRDGGVVLAHLRQPLAGARVAILQHVLAERRVRDLTHQRVLERPLARVEEARLRLLHEHLGAGERAEHVVRAGDAERGEAAVPPDQAVHAELRRRLPRRVVERVEVHLDGGFDRRRRRRVLPFGGEARQLLGEERRAGGLLRDRVGERVAGFADGMIAEHRLGDGANGLLRQRPKLDFHVIAARKTRWLVAPEGRARGEQHPQRAAGGAPQEVIDPREALGVGPLRVLQGEDERRGLCRGERDVGEGDPQGVA